MSIKKGLRLCEDDNVIILLEDVASSDVVSTPDGKRITSLASIPAGHKIACANMEQGTAVKKYGYAIGHAKQPIREGDWVHVHNVSDVISSWGNSDIEYNPANVKEIDDSFLRLKQPALMGYRRKNGMVGFRNHLLVLSTVVCANQIVRDIGIADKNIITIENPTGCTILPNEVNRLRNILLSLAMNPNTGAVIFVGLGCESLSAKELHEAVGNEKLSDWIEIQEMGSSGNAFAELSKKANAFSQLLKKQEREPADFSDIRLATECGGSDWTSTLISNPAIGYVSDIVVKNKGISMLGEVCGWFGGEGLLIQQSRTEAVAKKVKALLSNVYERALTQGRSIDEGNPTPGNIEGGITTLCEKALGNVKKGGTAIVEDALGVAGIPLKSGLYVVDNPGLDPVSMLGLTCSSANIMLFSTGRGTPTGTPLLPAIKLTGSPTAASSFSAHMDVDLSCVVRGEMNIEQAGELLLDELIAVANGKLTIAERLGHREYAFPLMMGPL